MNNKKDAVFSADWFIRVLKGAAEGRCLWSTEIAGFEPLPREMQAQIVREIRQRKGLSPEPFPTSHYLGDI